MRWCGHTLTVVPASASLEVREDFLTNAWVDWSNFLVAHWAWLEEGSFRWSPPPLIQDGRYALHLGFGLHWFSAQRLGRLVSFFGGNWWKVPFDDRSSNIAATAAIFNLVSVDYLTNACRLVRLFGASLGVINHHVPLLPKPYRPYTRRQRPIQGHMSRVALPLFICKYQQIFIHDWQLNVSDSVMSDWKGNEGRLIMFDWQLQLWWHVMGRGSKSV
jgi:hypothetical protein